MHSHRQRRRSSSSGGPVLVEIPIPVCITLYNLFPHPEGAVVVHHNDDDQHPAPSSPAAAALTTTNLPPSSQPRWYRLPEHSRRLLRHPVQLEIVDSDDALLYSSVHPGGTIHPSWDLLDERFPWLDQANKTENAEISTIQHSDRDESSLWKKTYRSLTVRVRLLSSNEKKDSATLENMSVVLADAPLYPTMLQRLISNSSSSADDSSRRSNNNNNNNMSSLQGPQQLLPISLPPNSLVVFFSDGSIRVPSPLFQFLVERHVLDEVTKGSTSTKTKAKIASTANEVEDFDRFSDDVFATLDQVQISPIKTATSPLADHSPRKPRMDVSLIEMEEHAHDDEDAAAIASALEDMTACPLLVDEDDNDDEIVTAPPLLFSKTEPMSRLEDLRKEQLELQRLLDEEEQLWQQEVESLQEDKVELERLLSNSQSIQAETAKIRDATHQEMVACQQAEFSLEAHRIKLISELRTLYPIHVKSDQRYLIRGLELPRDVHSAVVSEDEVSAAFGYVTHLVGMLSKYMAVPLRYRLYCSSSRSAISLDGVAVFPLFSSRAVERDELDRAFQLLHRNVDCLLQSRDIRCPPNTHILAKLQRIYDKVIDGC